MVDAAPLTGLTVLSFESRRADAMRELILHHGGTPILAPSMRELPLQDSPILEEFLRRLEAHEIDILVLLTGSGTRTMVTQLSSICPLPRLIDLLRQVVLVARGPKPVRALRDVGLRPSVEAAEPNTWRELLAALDERTDLTGRRVAVQEYGTPNPDLLAGLVRRGAEVFQLPVYRWALPEDRRPLEAAIRRFAEGRIDVALFTSARQVDHVMLVAAELGLSESLRRACLATVVASVGPVCSVSLQSHDLPVDLEPEHPKMGHLLHLVAARGPQLVARKLSLNELPQST